MIKNKILKYVLSILLLCWSSAGFAAQPDSLYQIEVIIFSHITEQGLRSEYWPLLPPQSIPAKAVELPAGELFAEADWQLQSMHQLLKRNHYPILLHWAWQESAESLRAGRLIHLTGGANYGNNEWQVNGSLFIGLEHYFNIHFKLRFLMPWEDIKELNLTNAAHPEDASYVAFKMNERLRMRSNELNYIDHPLYGILIKITPLPPLPAPAA